MSPLPRVGRILHAVDVSCRQSILPLHKPYWYLCWKKDGKTKSKYVRKNRPMEV
jgi:hypothetical protein